MQTPVKTEKLHHATNLILWVSMLTVRPKHELSVKVPNILIRLILMHALVKNPW